MRQSFRAHRVEIRTENTLAYIIGTFGVRQIMRRMLQQSYQPTEATFAISLMAAGRLGYAEFAKDVFPRRTATGLEPKEEVYSSVNNNRSRC